VLLFFVMPDCQHRTQIILVGDHVSLYLMLLHVLWLPFSVVLFHLLENAIPFSRLVAQPSELMPIRNGFLCYRDWYSNRRFYLSFLLLLLQFPCCLPPVLVIETSKCCFKYTLTLGGVPWLWAIHSSSSSPISPTFDLPTCPSCSQCAVVQRLCCDNMIQLGSDMVFCSYGYSGVRW
jgi:hypothetical protein